jgi:hypothetical protein
VVIVEHKGEQGMSQEQEMRYEEVQRDEPKPVFEEVQRTEEIPGYRSYVSESAGQKIQEVSTSKVASPGQRLFLAVVSLGMLLFVSLISMFLFARMSMASAFGGPGPYAQGWSGDEPGWAVMRHGHEHGLMIINYGSAAMGNDNVLLSLLLLFPLVLFFIATIAVNVLFSRGAK